MYCVLGGLYVLGFLRPKILIDKDLMDGEPKTGLAKGSVAKCVLRQTYL